MAARTGGGEYQRTSPPREPRHGPLFPARCLHHGERAWALTPRPQQPPAGPGSPPRARLRPVYPAVLRPVIASTAHSPASPAPPRGFRWFPAVRPCWPDFPGQLLAVWGNKWCLPELRSPRLPLPRWSVGVCGSIFFRTSHKGKGNTLGDRNSRIIHLPPRTATIPPGIGAYPQHTPAYHRGSLAGLGLTRWGTAGTMAARRRSGQVMAGFASTQPSPAAAAQPL